MTTTDAEEEIPSMVGAGCKRNRNQTQHPDFLTLSDGIILYLCRC